MKNQSLTITGLIILAVIYLGNTVGIEIGQENLDTTIKTIGQLVGVVIAWYGRFRQGDINILGAKK